MAACEVMAWGLPGVSFDLEALNTYYPKGMIKTKCFDFQEFANNIIELLTNKELYNRLSKDSLDVVREEWDWNKRAEVIYSQIF
jgi:glycosyltransferase involved in cell wall biosynthesis